MRGGRGVNHDFFSGGSRPRPSQKPSEGRRETTGPKPGVQVLSRQKEEEKRPTLIIASRPDADGRDRAKIQSSPRVLPPPRDAPTEKEMLDSRRLISDGMMFEESILEFLSDNPHFNVTAAIGPQNAGKSTILSMLAGNNPQDKYRYYVFRPASREAVESSRYQTVRINIYVSRSRGIFLDCQATNSASLVEDASRHSRKSDERTEMAAYVECIQLIAFILQISNTVLVCSDYTVDLELVKILRTAEMIRANLNNVNTAALPTLNFTRKTNVVFVHTRANTVDFSFEVHKERVQLIRSLFSDSLRLRVSDCDDEVLMLLSVLRPRKDTTTQMHAQPHKEHPLDVEMIEAFENGIRGIRVKLAGLPREPFSEKQFTEKQWLALARTIWKDSSFSSAIDKLSTHLP